MSDYPEIRNEFVESLAKSLIAREAFRVLANLYPDNYGYEAFRAAMRAEVECGDTAVELLKDILGIDAITTEMLRAAQDVHESEVKLKSMLSFASPVAMAKAGELAEAHTQRDLMTFDGTIVRPPARLNKVSDNDG